ncbi:MAG TPA: rhodanese-like domain-containing protein [Rhizomicrobium sp.]
MAPSNPSPDYAGDIDVTQAWAMLKADPKAQLVDVRTAAEWTYVGLPDIADLGREVHTVEWQSFPSGAINPEFVSLMAGEMQRQGLTKDTPLLFLCRSGARSRSAAVAMARAGFTQAYNVSGGFEGNLDSEGHRGGSNGWKAGGLPWRQG